MSAAATSSKCRRLGCYRLATHIPLLRFCEVGSVCLGEFASEVTLDIKLCARHVAALEPEELYTDDGWLEIVEAVMAMGYGEPDRASVDMVARPLRLM